MNEKYWIDQVAKKDAKIDELNSKLNEAYRDGEYYKGMYTATIDKLTNRTTVDETFEDVLTEKELKNIKKK